jgi:hypothetical protein
MLKYQYTAIIISYDNIANVTYLAFYTWHNENEREGTLQPWQAWKYKQSK